MQNNLLVNWTRQQHCSSRIKQISGSSVLNDLSQLIKNGVLLFLNTIRRQELRQIEIGLVAKTTIYEMGAGSGRDGRMTQSAQVSPSC